MSGDSRDSSNRGEFEGKVTAHIRVLGNPYAKLSLFPEIDETIEQASCLTEPPIPLGISKAAFRADCARIFRQYEPLAARNSRLRPEFQEFIRCNERKSAALRAAILNEIRRYDLGSELQAHLNRERPSDIAEKLKRISDAHPRDFDR